MVKFRTEAMSTLRSIEKRDGAQDKMRTFIRQVFSIVIIFRKEP